MNTYDIILDKKENSQHNKDIESYFLEEETEPITFLPNFNKINIIVGANNSGKSRFMRYFMTYKNLNGVNDLIRFKDLISNYNYQVKDTNREIKKLSNSNKIDSENTIYADAKKNTGRENMQFLETKILNELNFENLDTILNQIKTNKTKLSSLIRFRITNHLIENFIQIQENFLVEYKEIKRYYIPTLRTAHSLFQYLNIDGKANYGKIENDIFSETLNKYYGINMIDVKVFTGIHLYKEILNARNSKRTIRKLFEKFEKFISGSFFGNKKIDIVAEFDKNKSSDGNNEDENIIIDIEGEKETRKLYDLGDGIQAIIILMYQIFMAESNSFIFIDEPELNLHPGMQRLFLEQICNNKDLTEKNLTYIISTHSNHFLDLTIEKENVSLYSFSPKNTDIGETKFIIKNVYAGDNQILKNLGVNNSSVFMANCSIWVEGISDRNYIKAFLKSYCDFLNEPFPKEDIDFAFFEYAGSNIDHYIFENEIEKEDEEIVIKDIKALAISNRIFLLADSDATKLSTKKGKRLQSLEDAKTENFVPKISWNIREIENLLTNEMWKEILIDLCNKTLVKTNPNEIKQRISNALDETKAIEYSKKYIGEFLEVLRKKIDKISSTFILNQSNYEVKKNSKDETTYGSIINKRELSEIVFEKNFSWEILSKNDEIKNLTIEIYDFIINK